MKIIRKNLILISFIFILLIILGIIFLQNKLNKEKYYNITIDNITKESEDNKTIDVKEELICMVDIKGAVKLPGVYQSNCDKYVSDIISLAGGLTENADTTYTNLAKKVSDEMVIVIYTKEEIDSLKNIRDDSFECVCPEITNDACLLDTNSNSLDVKLININTASISELMEINGIGEARAKAIIEYREKNGKFKKIDDILNVSGIGAALYEQIKAYITT